MIPVLRHGQTSRRHVNAVHSDIMLTWQGDVEKIRKLLSTSARVLANTVDENRRRCDPNP